MNKVLNNLENSKVLILGFAREGISTYKFIRARFPKKTLGINDVKQKDRLSLEAQEILKKDKNIVCTFGDNYLSNLNDYQFIVKTPGIPNKLPQIKEAIKKGIKMSSQVELFLEMVEGITIGITGTKGKSTTTSLIYHILHVAGKSVQLIGNIGKPVLDFVDIDNPKTIFVMELSSHQLSTLKKSPHIAVFLNIFPEHLDYYEDFEDYFEAKTHIAKFQTENDFFVYLGDERKISDFAEKVKSSKVAFSKNDELPIKLSETHLLGKHNELNVKAAIKVVKLFGVDDALIKSALKSFRPLETRLEIIAEIDTVVFVSDSLSTIPQAAIAAAESFADKEVVQILGGMDRGLDLSLLGTDFCKLKQIKAVILVGELADKIEKILRDSKFAGRILNLGKASMQEIVQNAYKLSSANGLVLLSPGATSFDMFIDYKDRADQFKNAVKNLMK